MDYLTIFLVVIFLLMVIMFAVGLKFPQGLKDWPLDKRATASIFLAILVFVLLIILSYYASQQVKWPSNTELALYIGIIIIVVLIVAAIILPEGFLIEGEGKSD